mmetsp:Transcript_28965/g.56621  ORF Transcript_28965/g.56621 Transcript_28965/m.56621 type:complete len:88 (-) Transcript_28965:67-330(-)
MTRDARTTPLLRGRKSTPPKKKPIKGRYRGIPQHPLIQLLRKIISGRKHEPPNFLATHDTRPPTQLGAGRYVSRAAADANCNQKGER